MKSTDAFSSGFIEERNLNCDSIIQIYPLIKSLNGFFYTVDSFEIRKIIKNDLSIIDLTTFHSDGKNKTNSRNMTFYLKKDKLVKNRYVIADSKGLCLYKGFSVNDDMLEFGKKIGAITKEDSTDLVISNKMANVEIFHKFLINALAPSVRDKMNLLDWIIIDDITLESFTKVEIKNHTYKGNEYEEFLKLGIIK